MLCGGFRRQWKEASVIRFRFRGGGFGPNLQEPHGLCRTVRATGSPFWQQIRISKTVLFHRQFPPLHMFWTKRVFLVRASRCSTIWSVISPESTQSEIHETESLTDVVPQTTRRRLVLVSSREAAVQAQREGDVVPHLEGLLQVGHLRQFADATCGFVG